MIILSVAGFYFIVNSDGFFNFGMRFSYFTNKIYYMYYRTIYTIELGYYKNVEYFVQTFEVLSILVLFLFLLRKTRFKLKHIFLLFSAVAVLLNFSSFTKENLIARQNYDLKMVKARNIYYRLYSYLISKE